jgi:hypothetical protein
MRLVDRESAGGPGQHGAEIGRWQRESSIELERLLIGGRRHDGSIRPRPGPRSG